MITKKEFDQKKMKLKPFAGTYLAVPFRKLALLLADALEGSFLTPNMVSLMSAGFALAAALILAFVKSDHAVIAVPFLLSFEFCGILDGSLARKKQIFSPFGSWINMIAERLGYMLIGISFSWHAYKVTGEVYVLFCALIAVILREGIGVLDAITVSKMPAGWEDELYSERSVFGGNRVIEIFVKTFFYTGIMFTMLLSLALIFRVEYFVVTFMMIYGLLIYLALLVKIGRTVYQTKLSDQERNEEKNIFS